MRALFRLIALALGLHAPAQGAPAPAAAPPAPGAQTPDSAPLAQDIARRRAAGDRRLPDADHFTYGNRYIDASTEVDGPIAVARGDLDVYGTVRGDVVTLDGNVRIHRGGLVTGNAWAAGGTVLVDGGSVEGGMRALALAPASSGAPAAARGSVERAPLTTVQSVKLVLGWLALLAIIGIGVMVFAESNLDGVVIALERGFARSFWIGLAGQVVALPALVALVVGLAITVIGVLLVPFAVVAYVIAVAGLVTLGFLAVARLSGGSIASTRGTRAERGVHLRALIIGLTIFLGIWMLAALFAWNPVVGAALRGVATVLTWVAATAGLGATLASRGGTQRSVGAASGRLVTDDLSWQTPTPVSGVAAATRRVAAAK